MFIEPFPMLWELSWEIWEVKSPTDFLSTGLALRFEQWKLSTLYKSQEHFKSTFLSYVIFLLSWEISKVSKGAT